MIFLNPDSDLDSIMEMKDSAPKTPQTSLTNNSPSTPITPTKSGTAPSIFSMDSPDWLTQSCPSINLENKSNSSINISKKRKANIFIANTFIANAKTNENKKQNQKPFSNHLDYIHQIDNAK